MTDEDFEKARVPATQTFEIRAFVAGTEVEDLYFDHPYYVGPQGRAGMKAYALLRDALAETGKLAIGTIVLRQREHLGALGPAGEALVLTTMRFAHEIRSPKHLDLPGVHKGWSEKEMKLTRQLMDTLSDEWDPKDYRDTYTDALRAAIEAKVQGKEIVTPEAPKRPRVASLMQALEASLKEGRPPLSKVGSRKRQRAGRPAARRRAA